MKAAHLSILTLTTYNLTNLWRQGLFGSVCRSDIRWVICFRSFIRNDGRVSYVSINLFALLRMVVVRVSIASSKSCDVFKYSGSSKLRKKCISGYVCVGYARLSVDTVNNRKMVDRPAFRQDIYGRKSVLLANAYVSGSMTDICC